MFDIDRSEGFVEFRSWHTLTQDRSEERMPCKHEPSDWRGVTTKTVGDNCDYEGRPPCVRPSSDVRAAGCTHRTTVKNASQNLNTAVHASLSRLLHHAAHAAILTLHIFIA